MNERDGSDPDGDEGPDDAAYLLVPPLDPVLDFADRLNALLESPAGPSSNDDLAKALREYSGHERVNPDRISRLRRGQRPNPGIAIIPALCEVYGVPPAYWFSEVVAGAVQQAVTPVRGL